MRQSTSLLVLAALLLSGCAGASPADPAGSSVAPPTTDLGQGTGSIEGVVVDDSQQPLAGATVVLEAGLLQAVATEEGSFGFTGLAPGSYRIDAVKPGFAAAGKDVEVVDGAATRVILTLSSVAVQESFHETFGPFNGYFDCSMGTPRSISPCTGDTFISAALGANCNTVRPRCDFNSLVFPNTKAQMPYMLASDDWSTMVGESRWSQGSFATGPGMSIYPSFSTRPTSHWWCSADGRSPLNFHYERPPAESVCFDHGSNKTEATTQVNPLVLVADPGFGGTSSTNPPARLMLQQRFELLMTVFYGDPAPAGYGGFQDQ